MSKNLNASLEQVRAAKSNAERIFTDLVGNVAIGITRVDGVYGLKINLHSAPVSSIDLPAEVDGIPVRVEVTGPIKKRTRL